MTIRRRNPNRKSSELNGQRKNSDIIRIAITKRNK